MRAQAFFWGRKSHRSVSPTTPVCRWEQSNPGSDWRLDVCGGSLEAMAAKNENCIKSMSRSKWIPFDDNYIIYFKMVTAPFAHPVDAGAC